MLRFCRVGVVILWCAEAVCMLWLSQRERKRERREVGWGKERAEDAEEDKYKLSRRLRPRPSRASPAEAPEDGALNLLSW